MKVQITLVDPRAELRRDLKGYRLTFKYADDADGIAGKFIPVPVRIRKHAATRITT